MVEWNIRSLGKQTDALVPRADSHEGVILWRIVRKDFVDNADILERFRETYAFIDPTHQGDEKTIVLGASDDGSADEMVYALIECYFRRKLGGAVE